MASIPSTACANSSEIFTWKRCRHFAPHLFNFHWRPLQPRGGWRAWFGTEWIRSLQLNVFGRLRLRGKRAVNQFAKTTVQSQKAVAAYFTSKQLLSFGFADADGGNSCRRLIFLPISDVWSPALQFVFALCDPCVWLLSQMSAPAVWWSPAIGREYSVWYREPRLWSHELHIEIDTSRTLNLPLRIDATIYIVKLKVPIWQSNEWQIEASSLRYKISWKNAENY